MQRTVLFVLLMLATVNGVEARDTVLWRGVSDVGIIYRQGLRDSAQAKALQLLETARKQADFEVQAMMHVLIGTALSEKGDKVAALAELSQGADIAETHNLLKTAKKPQFRFLYQTLIPTYAHLVLLCDELGKPEKCLHYAQKGLEWTANCDDKKAAAFSAGILTEMLVKHGGQMAVTTPRDTGKATPAAQPTPTKTPVATPAEDKQAKTDTIIREKVVTHTELVPMEAVNKRLVVGLFSVVGLAFLLYIVWQRRRRRRTEQEAEQQAEARFREGQEEERSRLARELHDGVGNQLLAIEMKLRDEGGLSTKAIEMLSESRQQVRRVSHELLPPEFEHTTLDAVLRNYAEAMDGAGACAVSYSSTPAGADWSRLSQPMSLEVYRIVQEAVGNAMKHGMATTVSIGMHQNDDGQLTVIVSNDGSCPTDGERPAGIGLRTMKQRAAAIGGTITFHQLPFGYVVKLVVKEI